MTLISHNKNAEDRRRVAATAAGRHIASGHLLYSYATGAAAVGTAPATYQVYLRQILGRGVWGGVEKVFYELSGGTIIIPAADYIFHDGTQTTPGAFFPTDSPHTGFVMIDIRLPVGIGDFDTDANPPTGARVIAKTQVFPDFDASGNQLDSGGVIVSAAADALDESKFFYTANPARVIAGRMLVNGKIKRARINYPVWTRFRDFHAGLEANDYTTIENFDGFGLTGSYFNGANFETFVTKRVDKSVFFASSAGAPASGVNADNFSVRWEGFIKAKFAETYTVSLTHTHGGKVTVGGNIVVDKLSTTGTDAGTFSAAANTFYPITVEWTHTTGNAEINLKWSSPSTPIEIIKPASLYPKAENLPRYELHDQYSTPTDLETATNAALVACNSIKQDVGGKIEFYCVEQLTPTFDFDDSLPETERQIISGTVEFSRSDTRRGERQNIFESEARNLLTEYLEKPDTPVRLVAAELLSIAGREITGGAIPLPNMTPFQQVKVLRRVMNLAVVKDLKVSFDATKKTYAVICGDVVTLTLESAAFIKKLFQVISTIDFSPDDQAGKRRFTLQEI